MTVTVQTGSIFRFQDDADMQVHDQLPAGTYNVKFNEMFGFYLDRIDNFELPAKIYGDITKNARRILNTFIDRPLSTGVLFSGIKGSGKTLLAKQTAVEAARKKIPTIVINNPWHGDDFNSFIQAIDCPAIVLFDEFEKVYDWNHQEKILTLLDGVFPTKKLFLLTTNNSYKVSEFLKNRPGRVYYKFDFGVLDQQFIKEYCEDRLENKEMIEHILKYTNVFSFFNFDMLGAAVEEMNRYGETLPEVLEILNIEPESTRAETYEITTVINGKTFLLHRKYNDFEPNQFEYQLWAGEEMNNTIEKDRASAKILNSCAEEDQYGRPCIEFTPSNISSFDHVETVFTYKIERNGKEIELQAKRNKSYETWKYSDQDYQRME